MDELLEDEFLVGADSEDFKQQWIKDYANVTVREVPF